MIPSPHIPAGPSNEDVDGASELLMDGARFGDLEDVTNALELGINANTSLNAGTTGVWHLLVRQACFSGRERNS